MTIRSICIDLQAVLKRQRQTDLYLSWLDPSACHAELSQKRLGRPLFTSLWVASRSRPGRAGFRPAIAHKFRCGKLLLMSTTWL